VGIPYLFSWGGYSGIVQNFSKKCPFFTLKIVKTTRNCVFFGTPGEFLPLIKGIEGFAVAASERTLVRFSFFIN
jgi:hypothetical protein